MRVRHAPFLIALVCSILTASFGALAQTTSTTAAPVREGSPSSPANAGDGGTQQSAATATSSTAADDNEQENGRRALSSSSSKVVLTAAAKRNLATRYGVFLTEKDKRAAAMDDADARQFAAFLERDDAGFVRLYDASGCEANHRILNVADECPPNMLGRGTSYSFRRKKYQFPMFSDIRLERDVLRVTGLNVLGFLTNLGDAPLDDLTLESAGVAELSEFRPADELDAINRQIRTAVAGFKIGDFFYKTTLPLSENAAYALRSVAYGGKVVRRVGPFEVNVLSRDKRHDVIIVFRVIRRHDNGSVSLLWRELRRADAPKLEFPKRKKNETRNDESGK